MNIFRIEKKVNDSLENGLKKVYHNFGFFAEPYKVDFYRFLEDTRILGVIKKQAESLRLLDIGCGPGILLAAAAGIGINGTGIDKYIFPCNKNDYFTIKDLEVLRQLWKEYHIEILPWDYKELEKRFQPETFDVIFCDAFIEHLKEPPRYLFETVRKLLKDGGYFIISTPNLASALKRIRFLCGYSCMWKIEDYWKSDLFLGHTREFTAGEIGKMCEWAGFKVIKLYTKKVFPIGSIHKIGLWRKIIRLIAAALSYLIPYTSDVIYCVAQKRVIKRKGEFH